MTVVVYVPAPSAALAVAKAAAAQEFYNEYWRAARDAEERGDHVWAVSVQVEVIEARRME